MEDLSKLIQRFAAIEAMAEKVRNECHLARVHLERVSSPAPSRGRKKKLSEESKATLAMNLRKNLIRKQFSA